MSSDPSGAQASLRSVTGSVSKIDAQSQSITLDQAAGNLTLTVDSTTRVWRNGRPLLGIQSIREGQKVRASFDPASNRASKIEVMGGKRHGSSKSDQTMSPTDDTSGKIDGTSNDSNGVTSPTGSDKPGATDSPGSMDHKTTDSDSQKKY